MEMDLMRREMRHLEDTIKSLEKRKREEASSRGRAAPTRVLRESTRTGVVPRAKTQGDSREAEDPPESSSREAGLAERNREMKREMARVGRTVQDTEKALAEKATELRIFQEEDAATAKEVNAVRQELERVEQELAAVVGRCATMEKEESGLRKELKTAMAGWAKEKEMFNAARAENRAKLKTERMEKRALIEMKQTSDSQIE